MNERTLSILRISPVHPRRPEPSHIEIMLMPTDRKTTRLDLFTITVEQALALAEQALAAARIVRDAR